MNDMGTSITVTGMVATLIAVVFAVAAWYVSRKRQAGGVRPQNSADARRPTLQVQESEPTEENPLYTESAAQTPAGKPLFKRLGAQGVEEAVSEDTEDSNEYIWE